MIRSATREVLYGSRWRSRSARAFGIEQKATRSSPHRGRISAMPQPNPTSLHSFFDAVQPWRCCVAKTPGKTTKGPLQRILLRGGAVMSWPTVAIFLVNSNEYPTRILPSDFKHALSSVMSVPTVPRFSSDRCLAHKEGRKPLIAFWNVGTVKYQLQVKSVQKNITRVITSSKTQTMLEVCNDDYPRKF